LAKYFNLFSIIIGRRFLSYKISKPRYQELWRQPTTSQRCCSETEKKIIEDLFNSVLLLFKKYHSSGNLKFYNLVIFQSLKLRILVEKILPSSLKLNFFPNTLGCSRLRLIRRFLRYEGHGFRTYPSLLRRLLRRCLSGDPPILDWAVQECSGYLGYSDVEVGTGLRAGIPSGNNGLLRHLSSATDTAVAVHMCPAREPPDPRCLHGAHNLPFESRPGTLANDYGPPGYSMINGWSSCICHCVRRYQQLCTPVMRAVRSQTHFDAQTQSPSEPVMSDFLNILRSYEMLSSR